MPTRLPKKDGANKVRPNILSPKNQRALRGPLTASSNSPVRNPIPNANALSNNGAKKEVAENNSNVPKPSTKNTTKKNCNLLYTTYFDNGVVQSSNIEPTEEFVTNEYNNEFLHERWNKWISRLPKWMLDFEPQRQSSLQDTETKQQNKKTEEDTTGRFNENINFIEVYPPIKSKDDQEETETEDETTEMTDSFKENREVKLWKEWSIQLTKTGKLCITGKPDHTMTQQTKDVSLCKRVDAMTLIHPDGSVSTLVGMPDHFTNVPYYVRNKFQCGFPEDWKKVKSIWLQYINEGNPYEFEWNDQSDQTRKLSDGVTSRPYPSYCHNNTFIMSPPPLTTRQQQKAGKLQLSESVMSHKHDESLSSFIVPAPSKPNDATFTREPSKPSHSLAKQVFEKCLKRNHMVTSRTDAKRLKSKLLEDSIIHSSIAETEKSPNLSSDSLHLVAAGSSTPIRKSPLISKATGSDATVVASQEIVLHNWMPILVKGNDIRITGYIKNGKQADVSHTTGIVHLRKSFTHFHSVEGSSYILTGPLADDSSIPNEIRKKLCKGLPIRWKLMIKQWATLVSASSSKM